MPKVTRFAPDTNYFLHARHAKELPWLEISNADQIEIIVLGEVLAELDRHKSGGNSRRSRRAREAFQLIDPLIDDDAEEVEVRSDPPRVVWKLAPTLDASRVRPSVLDLSTPDGRIVEQAFAVKELLGGDLALFTHDRLPRLLAKSIGLSCQRIPEHWLLPPEADEKDKENAKLREQLRALSSRAPEIKVDLLDGEDPITRIAATMPRYEPLPVDVLDDAVAIVLSRNPVEQINIPGQISVVTDYARIKYTGERSKWETEVRRYLERQPARLNLMESVCSYTLRIRNTGFAPAEAVEVDVWVEGALRIVNHQKNELVSRLKFFKLPSAPQLERSSAYDPFSYLRSPQNFANVIPKMPPLAREPSRFYWDYEDELFCEGLAGSCQDFRHQVAEVDLPVVLTQPEAVSGAPTGCLRIRCSARNLPTALEWSFPIRLEYEFQDSEDAVRDLLLNT